jgi:hypothetical protein
MQSGLITNIGDACGICYQQDDSKLPNNVIVSDTAQGNGAITMSAGMTVPQSAVLSRRELTGPAGFKWYACNDSAATSNTPLIQGSFSIAGQMAAVNTDYVHIMYEYECEFAGIRGTNL